MPRGKPAKNARILLSISRAQGIVPDIGKDGPGHGAMGLQKEAEMLFESGHVHARVVVAGAAADIGVVSR